MGKSRNIARIIVDESGDIAAGNLDNAVPADGSITAAKLAATLDLTTKTLSYPDGSVAAADLASTLDLSTKTLTYPSGSVTAGNLASTLDLTGKTVTLPAGVGGKVLQVVSSVKTDSYFTTSGGLGSWLDIPGQGGIGTWSVSITPSSSSNKILILSMLTFRNDYYGAALRLRRDSTSIAVGDSVSNTFQGTMGQFWLSGTNEITRGANISFLDSPATTSAIVYKVQFQGNSNGSYIGRTVSQTSSIDNGVYPSSIIAIEVST